MKVKKMVSLLAVPYLVKKSGLFGKKRSLGFKPALPVGGVLPIAAYLLWRNRDKIGSLYHRVMHHQQPAAAAA